MRWKNSLTIAAAVGVALFSADTLAGPNYNHAGLALGVTEIDDSDNDGDGLRVDGSFAPARYFHVLGSYSSWDYDDGGVERSDFTIGAGGRAPISRSTDVVGELFYVDREWSYNGNDDDDDGFGFRAGVRSMVTGQLDLGGGLVHYDMDEDDETGLYGEAYYKFVPEIAAGAELEATDENQTMLLGGRFHF